MTQINKWSESSKGLNLCLPRWNFGVNVMNMLLWHWCCWTHAPFQLLYHPQKIVNKSPGINIAFIMLGLDPPEKTDQSDINARCTAFSQCLPALPTWDLSSIACLECGGIWWLSNEVAEVTILLALMPCQLESSCSNVWHVLIPSAIFLWTRRKPARCCELIISDLNLEL